MGLVTYIDEQNLYALSIFYTFIHKGEVKEHTSPSFIPLYPLYQHPLSQKKISPASGCLAWIDGGMWIQSLCVVNNNNNNNAMQVRREPTSARTSAGLISSIDLVIVVVCYIF